MKWLSISNRKALFVWQNRTLTGDGRRRTSGGGFGEGFRVRGPFTKMGGPYTVSLYILLLIRSILVRLLWKQQASCTQPIGTRPTEWLGLCNYYVIYVGTGP